MKLVIWGTPETGKTSLTHNFQKHFHIPLRESYKGGDKLKLNSNNYIVKALIDDRINEDTFFLFDDDVKHILIYRKNLLSQFLAWHHIDALFYNQEYHNNKLKVEELDVTLCKNFLDMVKRTTAKTYSILKDRHLYCVSYEDLFFNKKSIIELGNFLELNLNENDWETLIEPQKIMKNPDDVKLASYNDIERFNYKQNFNILKDMFVDEQLIL